MELATSDCAVDGVVKRAYPLRTLRTVSAATGLTSPLPGGGELDAFGPGIGPCGADALQLMTVEVENPLCVDNEARSTFETCLVFMYDKWAAKLQFLQRHYKLRIGGGGLVALEWQADGETEERLSCFVLAERHILKKTLERSPRVFVFPHKLAIEVIYEEPRRLPDSDQLRYLPPNVITTRDLHTSSPTKRLRSEPPTTSRESVRGKRTLRQAKVVSSAYRYSTLSELVPGNADLYGVVVNLKLPKRTGGRDFCMTLSLTDESCPTRAEAIQVNVFYPTIATMPKIKFVGDVVRFHKLKIQQYKDKVQGISCGRATRCLVLREGVDGQLEQQTHYETWTFEDSDEKRTRELIKWSQKSLAEDVTLPVGCPQAPPMLTELSHAEGFVDIVVRVLLLNDSEDPVRLVTWDGSGDAEDSDPNLVLDLQNHRVSVPEEGVLKEVIVDSCWPVICEMGFIPDMRTHWCRFRNLAIQTNESLPGSTASQSHGATEVLRFREVSSLMLLPEFALDVQQRLAFSILSGPAPRFDDAGHAESVQLQAQAQAQAIAQRAGARAATTPAQSTTSIPDHVLKNIPVTLLRSVLNSAQTPRKFHCRARVRSIWPSDVAKFCKLKPGGGGEYLYSFVMTLEDTSALLDVILYGKDAEHFLQGIPPCDLAKSTSSKALLDKRFAALVETPNVLHWCIKSYKVSLPPVGATTVAAATGSQEGHASTAIRYRVFDTLLQCT